LNTFLPGARASDRERGLRATPAQKKFDLIYLVKVFEHLPVWRDFLAFIERNLEPGGVCLILCPKYSFPYESHFWASSLVQAE
jgi:2-polyprenyl-3-methyl-5-hydroxy-6-metoxy-1,4-benzoquinol methylase